ncbi:MAG: hypothetical protein ABR571_05225 [Jatrophihabitans sp.]|uniref:hypothetical protein n=1 Tax=Jatrophihabitans sp. TaxID=1932789 RepID=UPI00390DC1CC
MTDRRRDHQKLAWNVAATSAKASHDATERSLEFVPHVLVGTPLVDVGEPVQRATAYLTRARTDAERPQNRQGLEVEARVVGNVVRGRQLAL